MGRFNLSGKKKRLGHYWVNPFLIFPPKKDARLEPLVKRNQPR